MPDAESPPPNGETRPLADVAVPDWLVSYVAATGSTNAVAAAAARSGALGDRAVVVTDHQTAGRGRLDRVWETPAGVALTFSAVVDPHQPDVRWPWLPLLTGLAVATAVRRTSGLDVALKWPNDVLVGDLKLAGILVERVAGPAGPVAVVGVGLNVHQCDLPVPTATSLALQGVAVDRADLLEHALSALASLLADWRAPGGAERLRAAYVEGCRTIGRPVRVHLPAEALLDGEAVDVDDLGRLVVRDGAGTRHVVAAGDVVHVRPSTDPPGKG